MFAAVLALAFAPDRAALGADSAELAAGVKEKIQNLRTESGQVRNQITVTLEELSRLTVEGVDLRPQFEKFTKEMFKMRIAPGRRVRADS